MKLVLETERNFAMSSKEQQNMFRFVLCCGHKICFGLCQSKNDASDFLSVIHTLVRLIIC